MYIPTLYAHRIIIFLYGFTFFYMVRPDTQINGTSRRYFFLTHDQLNHEIQFIILLGRRPRTTSV